jgi:hypothetical protein
MASVGSVEMKEAKFVRGYMQEEEW